MILPESYESNENSMAAMEQGSFSNSQKPRQTDSLGHQRNVVPLVPRDGQNNVF
jgi:hypothetical protein